MKYIKIQNLKVNDANAFSSPITFGFPSLTGIIGAVHALEHKLNLPFKVHGVMVACNQYELKAYREHAYLPFAFTQKRQPLQKDGKVASYQPAGYIDIDVSLVLKVEGEVTQEAIELLSVELLKQRFVGGVVEKVGAIMEIDYQSIIPSLLPAFILVDATDELEMLNETTGGTFETISQLNLLYRDEEGKLHAHLDKQAWLVPMTVGYQAISLCTKHMKNSRDNRIPNRFVENVYNLGKWEFPLNMINNFDRAFWWYDTDANLINKGLYVIRPTNLL